VKILNKMYKIVTIKEVTNTTIIDVNCVRKKRREGPIKVPASDLKTNVIFL